MSQTRCSVPGNGMLAALNERNLQDQELSGTEKQSDARIGQSRGVLSRDLDTNGIQEMHGHWLQRLPPEIIIQIFACLPELQYMASFCTAYEITRAIYTKNSGVIIKRYLLQRFGGKTLKLLMMAFKSRVARSSDEASLKAFFKEFVYPKHVRSNHWTLETAHELEHLVDLITALIVNALAFRSAMGGRQTGERLVTESEHARIVRTYCMMDIAANLFHRHQGRVRLKTAFPEWSRTYWRLFSKIEILKLQAGSYLLKGNHMETVANQHAQFSMRMGVPCGMIGTVLVLQRDMGTICFLSLLASMICIVFCSTPTGTTVKIRSAYDSDAGGGSTGSSYRASARRIT
ncbi:hypothetical protein BJ170DRAFT_724979 [Xylariales sp. AK1849]|nr:hypothetical protein BJ170DRAFT_724979 [Xylariales sp. AK1849]